MAHFKTDRARKRYSAVLTCAVLWLAHPAYAQPAHTQTGPVAFAQGDDLDLSITYYTRVLTPEGVLRESRYEEIMMRRPGHVWTARVVPARTYNSTALPTKDKTGAGKAEILREHAHKHFNHVLLPRHVTKTGSQMRLEFVDIHERELIAIAPSEYENVSFDGSWANAFFLADPKIVATLPLINKSSPVAGARWHELTMAGAFQRVLWDETRMVPLLFEKGDINGTFLQRMEVKVQPELAKDLPWQNIKGYAQKEYADFLD